MEILVDDIDSNAFDFMPLTQSFSIICPKIIDLSKKAIITCSDF